mmetsp:Transcript_116903/g.183864  ORF Transcript_116903/g.183864 Transcript_116903/m.183864 type:complete len:81 (-) Transcript_116903:117-359(-)
MAELMEKINLMTRRRTPLSKERDCIVRVSTMTTRSRIAIGKLITSSVNHGRPNNGSRLDTFQLSSFICSNPLSISACLSL